MSMGWLIWFVAIKIELGKTQFSKQLALINIYKFTGSEVGICKHKMRKERREVA